MSIIRASKANYRARGNNYIWFLVRECTRRKQVNFCVQQHSNEYVHYQWTGGFEPPAKVEISPAPFCATLLLNRKL